MGIINRWYEILRIFLARDRLTVEELQEQLKLTPHTIKNNIKLLNNELIGIAQIHQDKTKYYIKINDFEQLDKIMSGSFKKDSDFNSSSKRIAYILKKLLFSKDYHVITDFAEELSVSRNTVNNDLKRARDLLKEYNVSIDSTAGKGIRIIGDALDKRLVYINLVQDYFHNIFISDGATNQLLQILSEDHISKKTINLLIKAIDVLSGAIQLDDHLNQPIPFYNNFFEDSTVFEKIIYFIESYYNISLSQYERDFISFPLNLNNTNHRDKKLKKEQTYLSRIFIHMVESIEASFVIELDRNFLYSEMSNHLNHLINRSIFHIPPNEIFFGEVEKKYPFSFEVAKVAADSIESDINCVINSTEVDYLTLYFEMALRSKTEPANLNVAIISNAGQGAVNIIQRQIDSIIGNDTQFTHFTETSYLEADLTKYFVIFTSIPLKNTPEAVPVIRISNILSNQWLNEELEKVIATNPNLINSTLYDVYNLDDSKDYITNLLFIIDQLQQQGLVNEEFKQRIIKREKKQLTIFDNGIAFPHEVNPKSDHITFALGVFDTEYVVNDDEINLMIVVAVPENLTPDNEQKLIELYDLIFRLTGDRHFKEDIASIRSKEEFIEYLENRRLSL